MPISRMMKPQQFLSGFLVGCVLMLCVFSAHSRAVPAAADIAHELAAGKQVGFESFLMTVDGDEVGRFIAPSLQSAPPDIRSATKSITALLVGIAIDRREIDSVDKRVADLVPPRYRNMLLADLRKAAITLRDLLTMRSGLECDDWNPKSPGHEDRMYARRDWVEFWASQAMVHAPGEEFSYCTGNVIAIGLILEQATGQSVDAYANKYLFGPLQIVDVRWERWNKNQHTDTGGHLRLAPETLLRIGSLVLEQGRHETRQVVSEQWIKEMTTPHVNSPRVPQSYGFLWWIGRTSSASLPATDLWWAQGNGGTILMVMPQLRAIMLTTGTRFNRPDAMEPMFWLRDRLLPQLVKQ